MSIDAASATREYKMTFESKCQMAPLCPPTLEWSVSAPRKWHAWVLHMVAPIWIADLGMVRIGTSKSMSIGIGCSPLSRDTQAKRIRCVSSRGRWTGALGLTLFDGPVEGCSSVKPCRV